MPTARARHILVPTEEECKDLMEKINGGADFGEIAKEHSKCPSGNDGGDLGSFEQGRMVPEFDKVIFNKDNEDFDKLHGPLQTQFGFHIIKIDERND